MPNKIGFIIFVEVLNTIKDGGAVEEATHCASPPTFDVEPPN